MLPPRYETETTINYIVMVKPVGFTSGMHLLYQVMSVNFIKDVLELVRVPFGIPHWWRLEPKVSIYA